MTICTSCKIEKGNDKINGLMNGVLKRKTSLLSSKIILT
jgi:hypothetical protein